MPRTPCTDPDERTDALGGEAPAAPGTFRHRIRRRPGLRLVWRVGLFLAGLLFIVAGFALAVLPGPLTIPPVLFGLWLWSLEFEWADRWLAPIKAKGHEAWEHARRHPISSSLVTVGGLAMAGAAIWAAGHFELLDRAREYAGLS